MASSSSSSSSSYHTRSNSLPNRPNLFVSQFDEQLNKLTSSSSSITSKLSLLNHLYESIDDLLQLPSSQEKLADDVLEGSIKLLDICSIITDVLVQMKEHAQQFQSILRRRCSKDDIVKEVAEYLKSRKAAMKAVSKALKELKKVDSNEITSSKSRVRECQIMSLSVLESVLVAIAGPKKNVVSKMFKSKQQEKVECFFVGFEAKDASLHPEKARSELEKMESNIKDVENGVECLFRHLIKTRTTILNIHSC